MSFASTLKILMERDGISNYKLAKTLGCSQSSVANWLNGTEPTIEYLQQLADIFSVSIDFLLNKTDKKEKPAVGGERQTSRLRSIARLEDTKITPEQDEKIADYIDYLLSKKDKE